MDASPSFWCGDEHENQHCPVCGLVEPDGVMEHECPEGLAK